MKLSPARLPAHSHNGLTTTDLSAAAGLAQFGAHLCSLAPDAWSSTRHWHTASDEFVLVLDGTLTLQDDHGLHDLGPMDSLCWPFGVANAHHLTNRGKTDARYLVVGARVADDICHYPDLGHRQINTATTWRVEDAAGGVLRGGDLPPELRNLPPLWGTPAAAAATSIQRAAGRVPVMEDAYCHPVLGGGLGPYAYAVLGDAGGLSQFGVHLETLPAGSQSSFRHWHMAEDELVFVLSGQVVLVEETETLLAAGDVAAWPANHPVGHCLQNRSDAPATYLTIGTRKDADVIHYPDHDLITHKNGTARRYTHADGRHRIQGESK